MTIKMARHGDIELAYETTGAPTGEPLLLISGIAQMSNVLAMARSCSSVSGPRSCITRSMFTCG